MASGPIDEEKCAGWPLASFHVGEVLGADEICQRSSDRKEQRLGCVPAPLRTPGETRTSSLLPSAPIADHDLTELLVARQQLIERPELAQRVRRKRPAHVLVDKRLEPIPQGARLRRDRIELTGNTSPAQGVQHVVGNQSSLLEPRQQVLPRSEPFDLGVHRHRDGVQEIETEMVGDEKGWWARDCHRSLANSATKWQVSKP